MSSLAGKDNCTDTILDFISSGESGGNYNAVIGDAHAAADLGAMTLSQIYGLMDTFKAANKPSTATGRYQIIRATLQGLQASLKLGMDEMFTPALQDKLAVALMVEQGYSKWWTGALTDEDFAHGISLVWASLPDPQNGGKSHYDGIGSNHASTTLPAVYAVLQKARAAKGAVAPPPAPAPIPVPPLPGMVTVTMPRSVAVLVSQLLHDHIADVEQAISDLSAT